MLDGMKRLAAIIVGVFVLGACSGTYYEQNRTLDGRTVECFVHDARGNPVPIPEQVRLYFAASFQHGGVAGPFSPATPPRFLASMQEAVVGSLVAKDEEGRPAGELGLASHVVSVEILDGIAKTTVETPHIQLSYSASDAALSPGGTATLILDIDLKLGMQTIP